MSERLDYILFRRAYLEAGMFSGQHDQATLNLYDLELRELNREIHILSTPHPKRKTSNDWWIAAAVPVLLAIFTVLMLRC